MDFDLRVKGEVKKAGSPLRAECQMKHWIVYHDYDANQFDQLGHLYYLCHHPKQVKIMSLNCNQKRAEIIRLRTAVQDEHNCNKTRAREIAAKRLGVAYQTWCRWEWRMTVPTELTVKRACVLVHPDTASQFSQLQQVG